MQLRLKMEGFNIKVHECTINESALDVWLEHSYILNFLVGPMQRLLPRTLLHDGICDAVADSFTSLRSKFAL